MADRIALAYRYSYDADIELYLKVLNGDISEDVRLDRTHMLNGLKRVFEAGDPKSTGMLKKDSIYEALALYFPNKSDKAMAAIKRGLLADTSASDNDNCDINYITLFDEDTV